MSRLLHAALAAAAASFATWAVTRFLDDRRGTRGLRAERAIQDWENEGGSVAPPAGADAEKPR